MTAIELQKDAWYVRWFQWSSDLWQSFRDGHEMHDVSTNRCYFFRSIFFTAPFALACNVATIALAIATLTYYPIAFFGTTFFFGFWTVLILAAAGWFGYKCLPTREETDLEYIARKQKEAEKRRKKLQRGPLWYHHLGDFMCQAWIVTGKQTNQQQPE